MQAPPSALAHFYPLGEGGVVFVEGTRRLSFLNASSATIWCLLGDDVDPDALGRELARRFGITASRARQDAAEAVEVFRSEGLLDGGRPAEPPPVPTFPGIPPPGAILVQPGPWTFSVRFETPGCPVDFCCQDRSLGEAFTRVLSHFATAPVRDSTTRLAVLTNPRTPDSFSIFLDERCRVAGVSRNEVLPYLFAFLFLRSCRALEDRLLFHAAVLVREGVATLLPAETGGGKTTLAAALAATGRQFYSDELAVIDVERVTVSPFPLPMGIKRDSAKALEPYYPGLSSAPFSLRSDGKQVHYLPPPNGSLPPAGDAAQIGKLIFPRYAPQGETRLVALEKQDALQRLVKTGSSDRELSPADVRALVRIVDEGSCHALDYSQLGDALRVLGRLDEGQ